MNELLGTSFGVFIGLTLIITAGAAIMTGKAIAEGWRQDLEVGLRLPRPTDIPSCASARFLEEVVAGDGPVR